MKKLLRKSLIMTLAAVLLIGTFAISADAVMKKTIKPQEYTKKVSVANKKAAVVKKGTTKLTFKKGYGYIKFVAPATKTYKFTFSNLKGGKNPYEAMLAYKASKGYSHTAGGDYNLNATAQVLYASVALYVFNQGGGGLYAYSLSPKSLNLQTGSASKSNSGISMTIMRNC